MIKTIVYFTKIIILSIVAFLATSCNFNFGGIKGNGIEKSEVRKLSENFDKLEVKTGLEVLITQGAVFSVKVKSDENLIQYIKTEVVNGTLTCKITESINSKIGTIVYVTAPNFTEITTTSGSSTKTKNTLTGINLIAKATSGSEVDLSLEIENLQTQTTSGSTMAISGKALTLDSKSSSGSEFDSSKLIVNAAIVEATSGSSVQIYASQSLNATVSSGAFIEYSGNPKSIQKIKSSGGSIHAK